MKAMIWKEWRGNFKWAVLAAGGLALATLYALTQHNSNYAYAEQAWSSATMMTTIGAPLIATVLGFLQIFPEQRRDQWAFLIHRPATRSVIFGGKVIAGLALYLLATLPVVFGLNLWFAAPGHVAMPYDWHMILTGLADILDGVIFYFAAILTALRPARWYGSRALGLGTALIAGALVMTLHEFWQTLLAVLLCALVLGLAAWGSFLTDGTYRLQPKSAKFSLAATLLVGTMVVAGAALMLGAMIKDSFSPPSASDSTQYQIDQQGHVLRVTYAGNSIKQATDLNGKPVHLKPTTRYNSSDFITLHGFAITTKVFNYVRSYRDLSRYFSAVSYSSTDTNPWFYVPSQQLLETYSIRDRQLIGYLGPDGFAPVTAANTAPPGARFEGPIAPSYFYDAQILRFPQAVYYVDTTIPKVTLITQQQPGAIRGVCQIHNAMTDPNLGQDVAPLNAVGILVNKKIQIFSPNGKLLLTAPLQYDVPDYTGLDIGFILPENHYFFEYAPSEERELAIGHHLPSYIVEVSKTGAVLHRYTLPPMVDPVIPVTWTSYLSALIVPTAVVAGAAIFEQVVRLRTSHLGLPDGRIFAALTLVAALLCAVLTWRLGQRCAFSRREQWAWAITVFCLGPFGLLMLLALQGWPARQACPHCGQQRVVTREHCEHCGAEFSQPPPDGTEIFETAPAV